MIRRTCPLAIFLLYAVVKLSAQSAPPATAPLPTDPAQFLQLALAHNDVDIAGLKPWHLKATFQLFDTKGEPTETVSLDEIWGGPEQQRRTWSSTSFNQIEVVNHDGTFRSGTTSDPPMALERARRAIVHPMPSQDDIAGTELVMQKTHLGKIDLNCLMLSQPLKGVHEPLIGLFPTYCFDMDKTIYEVGYEFGDTAFLSGATGMFQSRYISLKVSIIVDKLTLATGAIDELKTIPTLDSGLFTPPPEAMHINMHPVQIEPHIAAGSIIKKVVPIYPALAVQARMEGTVILHAIIGREGRIHSLRIDTPSSTELTISAIAAVRQWTYKPYLINGEPTEVDTTITVNFRR